MTVHKIGGADAAGYSAYLASRDSMSQRGDYYLSPAGEQIEGIGQWQGRAAAELGLVGEVSREQLLRVWEGKDPAPGRSSSAAPPRRARRRDRLHLQCPQIRLPGLGARRRRAPRPARGGPEPRRVRGPLPYRGSGSPGAAAHQRRGPP
ncbi:MAG: relaxase domain-containing protein [Candidatus Dormibacteraeota bacterium]|uniref:Relaxase domain-containing protein n=1 Tax=Candidatus Amunia macphersoniae TaxID=3127014 RepID=A0A934KL72_9BACT|nr:relaxase domain-containing protein [Candidatus Dormibacteraeota bacterium]